MVIISNQQCKDIERYLTAYCETLDPKRTRDFNARRLVRKLLQTLQSKHPIPHSELPKQLKKNR